MPPRFTLRPLHRSGVLLICGVFIWLSASCEKSRELESPGIRPNIVLIMVDDLGYEGLGCNGSTSYQTPHLDALAESGVRFTHCFSTPLCTPSRVQMMTGKYNFRNYTEFGSLKPGETTFAHLFQDAGFATCVAGKWQLAGHYEGSNYRGQGTRPDEAGFDEHCLWQIDRLGSRYWDPVIQQNGVLLEELAGKYGPDVTCDFVVDFMQRHRTQPFLVYYPMILTHSPFMPTPAGSPLPEDRASGERTNFPDMVGYVDSLVGRIVKSLQDLGLRDRTWLIFTCDNGSPRGILSRMGDLDVKGNKGFTTDTGTHVPLIVSRPGTAYEGAVCEDLIDFTDFLPTLVQAGGLQLSGGLHVDGRSFLPQLLGRNGHPREWIFCHYDPRWGQWTLKRFARTKNMKLYGDGSFFDLRTDPREEFPLGLTQLSREKQEARSRLQQVLDSMAEASKEQCP